MYINTNYVYYQPGFRVLTEVLPEVTPGYVNLPIHYNIFMPFVIILKL